MEIHIALCVLLQYRRQCKKKKSKEKMESYYH